MATLCIGYAASNVRLYVLFTYFLSYHINRLTGKACLNC